MPERCKSIGRQRRTGSSQHGTIEAPKHQGIGPWDQRSTPTTAAISGVAVLRTWRPTEPDGQDRIMISAMFTFEDHNPDDGCQDSDDQPGDHD
jgi:hypothetical protein